MDARLRDGPSRCDAFSAGFAVWRRALLFPPSGLAPSAFCAVLPRDASFSVLFAPSPSACRPSPPAPSSSVPSAARVPPSVRRRSDSEEGSFWRVLTEIRFLPDPAWEIRRGGEGPTRGYSGLASRRRPGPPALIADFRQNPPETPYRMPRASLKGRPRATGGRISGCSRPSGALVLCRPTAGALIPPLTKERAGDGSAAASPASSIRFPRPLASPKAANCDPPIFMRFVILPSGNRGVLRGSRRQWADRVQYPCWCRCSTWRSVCGNALRASFSRRKRICR